MGKDHQQLTFVRTVSSSIILSCVFCSFSVPLSSQIRIPAVLRGDKKMTIKRLLPPAVNLIRKRIGVVSQAQGAVQKGVSDVFETRVVTAIQKDPNFILDQSNPETKLSFKMTEFRIEQMHIQDPVANPPKTCIVYAGRADVSYQAIEVKTGVPLDSENLTSKLEDPPKPKSGAAGISSILIRSAGRENCGSTLKTTEIDATHELFDRLVQQVTQRAAPVDETLEVYLPGGRCKDLSNLATEKRWSVLMEKAKEAKFDKPADDAGRLYLIGLANEAFAYDERREEFDLEKRVAGGATENTDEIKLKEEKFFRSAKSHLEEAGEFYREAIAANSRQPELKIPEGRIEYAIRLYATIERQRTEYAKVLKMHTEEAEAAAKRKSEEESRTALQRKATPSSSSLQDSGDRQGSRPEAKGLNLEIIELCENKLDEASVVSFIRDSRTKEVDMSAKALISLRRACGDSTPRYIQAMRAKVTTKRAGTSTQKSKQAGAVNP